MTSVKPVCLIPVTVFEVLGAALSDGPPSLRLLSSLQPQNCLLPSTHCSCSQLPMKDLTVCLFVVAVSDKRRYKGGHDNLVTVSEGYETEGNEEK